MSLLGPRRLLVECGTELTEIFAREAIEETDSIGIANVTFKQMHVFV